MKKLNNFTKLIIVLAFVFIAMNLFANDPVPPNFVVNIKTPAPCYDGGPVWTGPKWYKICTDTVFNLNNNEPPPDNWKVCCYYVKYFDRVQKNSQETTEEYQTNIVGVFFDGEDCEKRKKETIIQEFQEALYQKLCKDDPNNFNKLGYPLTMGGGGFSAYVYTTGGCYEKNESGIIRDSFNNPIPCNGSTYCCRQTKQIYLAKNSNGDLIITKLDTIINPFISTEPYYEVFPIG